VHPAAASERVYHDIKGLRESIEQVIKPALLCVAEMTDAVCLRVRHPDVVNRRFKIIHIFGVGFTNFAQVSEICKIFGLRRVCQIQFLGTVSDKFR
jgi:hypothetical protein